jgi:hypothetical protein
VLGREHDRHPAGAEHAIDPVLAVEDVAEANAELEDELVRGHEGGVDLNPRALVASSAGPAFAPAGGAVERIRLGYRPRMTSYWYVGAIAIAALVGLWFALGQPGMPPDEDQLASVRSELQTALLTGEPDRLSQLEQACGLRPGGGTRALSERLELRAVELDPMPWIGPRANTGRATVVILGGPEPCEHSATFTCSWRTTGEVRSTVHGPHVSTHGVTGERAVIAELVITRR